MAQMTDDEHFRQFAASLATAIDRYEALPEENALDQQKRQVETLVKLEKEFRRTLIKHPWGAATYRDFIHFICVEKNNKLAARPYFRERQEVFTQKISKALKDNDEKALYKFNFNYNFVKFVLGAKKWPKGSKIVKLAKEIDKIRTELVEMNMPLAISRARIFWSRTPKAQLSYMDLIQISAEGLMSAIDKFVLPYSRVFRAVAIGRMIGNFIEAYSETLVHFYPIDKRKLYRANKIVGRFADQVDYEALAKRVNEGVDEAHHTTAAEIADLMSAASCVSTDSTTPQTDPSEPQIEPVERFAAEEEVRPDVQYERAELSDTLATAMLSLSTLERKLLKLRGVNP